MNMQLLYDAERDEYQMVLEGKTHVLVTASRDLPVYAIRDARRRACDIIKTEVDDLASVIALQQMALLVRFRHKTEQGA